MANLWDVPIAVLWTYLAATAGVILIASWFLAKSADVMAEKTGLGRSFAGVVLLATATSLPELGTGVSSIVLVDAPDLAAGDAFGSNVFNLLIIGLLDLYWRNGPILNAVGTTSVVVGVLGIAVIATAVVATFIHGATSSLSSWPLSPLSILVLLMFLAAMFLIYHHDKPEKKASASESEGVRYAGASLPKAVLAYAVSATVVVIAAIWLSKTGDAIAKEVGLDESFVGTLFLAFSTSLPELATSIAAVRIKAPELAVSSVLGSNIFNMGVVLFIDDAVYTEGALWAGISQIHMLTGAMAVLMTAVVIMGLLTRPHRRPIRAWTFEGAALAGLYVAATLLVFKLA